MLFRDRADAGRFLAGHLSSYANHPDGIVLALPRGGVPVAFEVAKALHLPLDIFLVRKLAMPGHEELAMGAIASGGAQVLNPEILQNHQISEETIAQIVAQEQQELERQERFYRNDRPSLEVRGKTVILVDDGLASGMTMRVAVSVLQQKQPQQIVVAVPIASPETCAGFNSQADETVCARTPRPFVNIGTWYNNFSKTSDAEVQALLNRSAEFGQTAIANHA